jgi:tRNA pseudouridine55 synthase
MHHQRVPRRNLDGILVLDKPPGYSSNQALRQAKGLFAAAKAGHTGSLDPMATGMLVICFGQATKISGQLLDASKVYQATLKLGQTSDSLDAHGNLGPEVPVPSISEAQVIETLASFEGVGTQVPPMYSALKHQGQRLYALARAGKEVERAPRAITLHDIHLERFEPTQLSFSVHCSKGTYIRVLGADIAQKLGTQGHLVALRRTGLGPFTEGMFSFEALEAFAEEGSEVLDSALMPADHALQHLPALELDEAGKARVVQGQTVACDGKAWPLGQRVRLYGPAGQFLGLGEVKTVDVVAPKRLFLG